MIDTLKFANRLRSAGFSQEQAEAVAEAWADQAREDLPSRLDLGGIEDRITRLDGKFDTKFAQLDGKLDKLSWMVGFTLAGIVALTARLLLLGP
jgi:DNA-binding transcriptional MerR regulator